MIYPSLRAQPSAISAATWNRTIQLGVEEIAEVDLLAALLDRGGKDSMPKAKISLLRVTSLVPSNIE